MKIINLFLASLILLCFWFFNQPSFDKIYVINLERSKDRWEKITKQLNNQNISYERFEAIDGYKINIKDINLNLEFRGEDLKTGKAQIKLFHNYLITCNPEVKNPISFNYLSLREQGLSAGEFGIWCSNVVLWHEIKNKNYKNVLVLEDDVILTSENFKKDLDIFVRNLPKKYDIAYLDDMLYEGRKIAIPHNEFVETFSPGSGAWGAWAIVYSKTGIEKLLSYNCYSHALDNFFWSVKGSKIYLRPSCSLDGEDLNIYSSAKKLLKVPETGSEICKMGRGYWQC